MSRETTGSCHLGESFGVFIGSYTVKQRLIIAEREQRPQPTTNSFPNGRYRTLADPERLMQVRKRIGGAVVVLRCHQSI